MTQDHITNERLAEAAPNSEEASRLIATNGGHGETTASSKRASGKDAEKKHVKEALNSVDGKTKKEE